MKYICLSCNNEFDNGGDNAWQPCPECGGDAWWEDSGYNKGTIFTPIVPSWRKYESQMRSGDGHSQLDAAEKFTYERDVAVRQSSKMAKWEKSRRAWFQKQKHNWRNKEIAKLKEKGT
jgi:predicted  nucleic acid-binding Zn-ribbon protein